MAPWEEVVAQLEEEAVVAVLVAVAVVQEAAGMMERCQLCTKLGRSLSGQEGAHPRPERDPAVLSTSLLPTTFPFPPLGTAPTWGLRTDQSFSFSFS